MKAMLLARQAVITAIEMWDDRLSPKRTVFPTFRFKMGSMTSKNQRSNKHPSNQPLFEMA